jgi:hypothetical protein
MITDPVIISELPDVSILEYLHGDSLTQSDIETAMSSVVIRKKLQTLLEFELSDSAKDTLKDALKDSYIAYERNNGNHVDVRDEKVFVNNRLVSFSVDGFASGVFGNETFSNLFFTESVIDIIFTSQDKSFIDALIRVPVFWDKLFSTDAAIAHMEDAYGDIIHDAVNRVECAYVKYVAYKAGLDFNKYRDIEYLIEDSSAMDIIATTEAAKAVEEGSRIGLRARLMHTFGSIDLDAIADSEDNIDKISNDPALRSIVVNFDTVSMLPDGSPMKNFVINNDGYFGAIASERLNIDTSISLSNIFFDDTYLDERDAFTQDYKLTSLLLNSTLYPNFKSRFYESFMSAAPMDTKLTFAVDDSAATLVGHYTTEDFTVRKMSLSLSSFTETSAAAISDVSTPDRVYCVPYTFSDESVVGLQLDHTVMFSNADNYNLYDEFSSGQFDIVIGANGHLVGVKKDGTVVSSKFVTDLKLPSLNAIEAFDVCENSVFIKAESYYVYGNLDDTPSDIAGTLTTNIENIVNAVQFSDRVLVLGKDGEVKYVDGDELLSYEPASGISVKIMGVLKGRLVVLDDTGALKEIKSDGTVVDILSNVVYFMYGQDAYIVTTSDDENRAVFNHDDQWFVYDYGVNGL